MCTNRVDRPSESSPNGTIARRSAAARTQRSVKGSNSRSRSVSPCGVTPVGQFGVTLTYHGLAFNVSNADYTSTWIGQRYAITHGRCVGSTLCCAHVPNCVFGYIPKQVGYPADPTITTQVPNDLSREAGMESERQLGQKRRHLIVVVPSKRKAKACGYQNADVFHPWLS